MKTIIPKLLNQQITAKFVRVFGMLDLIDRDYYYNSLVFTIFPYNAYYDKD